MERFTAMMCGQQAQGSEGQSQEPVQNREQEPVQKGKNHQVSGLVLTDDGCTSVFQSSQLDLWW